MLLIVGTFRIPADRVEAARPAMAAMIAESRAEPGCIAYGYAEDALDPGLFRVIEQWRDREALTSHFTAPHLLEWRGQWARLGIHDRNLTLFHTGGSEPV